MLASGKSRPHLGHRTASARDDAFNLKFFKKAAVELGHVGAGSQDVQLLCTPLLRLHMLLATHRTPLSLHPTAPLCPATASAAHCNALQPLLSLQPALEVAAGHPDQNFWLGVGLSMAC
jgi:hypothetical protein